MSATSRRTRIFRSSSFDSETRANPQPRKSLLLRLHFRLKGWSGNIIGFHTRCPRRVVGYLPNSWGIAGERACYGAKTCLGQCRIHKLSGAKGIPNNKNRSLIVTRRGSKRARVPIELAHAVTGRPLWFTGAPLGVRSRFDVGRKLGRRAAHEDHPHAHSGER